MTIELDHFVVPSRSQGEAARRLAELFGVQSANEDRPAPRVYINGGLTLAFVAGGAQLPVHHYCFRVPEDEFEAIFARIKAAGIKYRSTMGGPVDMQINTTAQGRNVFWDVPDGHQWEILTGASYARP